MFSQKKSCKNCCFSETAGCRFGVKIQREILKANVPLEPCHKITTDRGEADFYRSGMDKVFIADLGIFRATSE